MVCLLQIVRYRLQLQQFNHQQPYHLSLKLHKITEKVLWWVFIFHSFRNMIILCLVLTPKFIRGKITNQQHILLFLAITCKLAVIFLSQQQCLLWKWAFSISSSKALNSLSIELETCLAFFFCWHQRETAFFRTCWLWFIPHWCSPFHPLIPTYLCAANPSVVALCMVYYIWWWSNLECVYCIFGMTFNEPCLGVWLLPSCCA